MADDREDREYLGDGLYVHFNGYNYAISVNDHKNEPVAYFEPDHLEAFNRFAERMKKKHSKIKNH